MNIKSIKKTIIIIPIYNPDNKFIQLLTMLKKQEFVEFDLYIIQTGQCRLDYKQYLDGFSHIVKCIKPEEFNHGRTRRLAALDCRDYEFLVYMTQDAVPANEFSIWNLLKCFNDSKVGCCFGRQVPNKDATPLAAFAREFNYPKESCIMDIHDVKQYGIKTSFLSDTFAAYRNTALIAVGGFPDDVILGEDAVVASRMILSGWKKAYCAAAEVYHSHNYSIQQEFKRYFDTGVFHGRNSWIRQKFGRAEGEGKRYICNEYRYLLQNKKLYVIPRGIFTDLCKCIAYNLGKHEKWLPLSIKRKCTMSKYYWKRK